MYIDDYIQYIENGGKWEGELEKYTVQNIYGINFSDYMDIKHSNVNTNHHSFVYF